MPSDKNIEFEYMIMDPTGNITALIADGFKDRESELKAAETVMKENPEVEQAGFVRAARADESGVQAVLRMAGGEFCGNASMSAAAWYILQNDISDAGNRNNKDHKVLLKVSGAPDPVEVILERNRDGSFNAGVHMPVPETVREIVLSFRDRIGTVPAVIMTGIVHLILEKDNDFFFLKEDHSAAQEAVRAWCSELSADGLGLMFLEKEGEELIITPLVYIPGNNTMFWENSCASGSSAAGMYLAYKTGKRIQAEFSEPGGVLKVCSRPEDLDTWLYGTVMELKR